MSFQPLMGDDVTDDEPTMQQLIPLYEESIGVKIGDWVPDGHLLTFGLVGPKPRNEVREMSPYPDAPDFFWGKFSAKLICPNVDDSQGVCRRWALSQPAATTFDPCFASQALDPFSDDEMGLIWDHALNQLTPSDFKEFSFPLEVAWRYHLRLDSFEGGSFFDNVVTLAPRSMVDALFKADPA